MKTNIKIGVLEKEITMTKATAKRASIFGTTEYEHLVKAMKDFPSFTVKITSPKPRDNRGLTKPLMKKLVREMTNNNAKAIAAFEGVIKCYEESSFHFSKPKAYFLAEYPNWREWLPQAEEQQEEQAQAEPMAAVEEQEQKEDLSKRFNTFRG
jgi:hypothetical protein